MGGLGGQFAFNRKNLGAILPTSNKFVIPLTDYTNSNLFLVVRSVPDHDRDKFVSRFVGGLEKRGKLLGSLLVFRRIAAGAWFLGCCCIYYPPECIDRKASRTWAMTIRAASCS